MPTYSINLFELNGNRPFAIARRVARGVVDHSPEPIVEIRIAGRAGRLADRDEAAFSRLESEPGTRLVPRSVVGRLLPAAARRWLPGFGTDRVAGRRDVLRGTVPATDENVDAVLRLFGPGLLSAVFRDAAGTTRISLHHLEALQFRLPGDAYRELCSRLDDDEVGGLVRQVTRSG